MAGSRPYIECPGYQTWESGRVLIDQLTYDQLELEKQIHEKLEKAAAAMFLEKQCEEFEHTANTVGYDYAKDEVGEEGRSSEPAPKREKPAGLTMPVFDLTAVGKRLQYDPSSTGDRDERRARTLRLEMMCDSGAERRLAQVQVDTEARLQGLGEDFQNFSEVIQYLRGVVAIAHADDRTPQPQHLLLCGPPGIGKTLFSQCIANILGTTLHVAHLETMQASSDLVGNSHTYSNSTTGLIFNTLIDGEFANPLILLDEIDKCAGDHRHPTISALYNLLEGTSASFHDESQPWLELDASRIIYIATANRLDTIDPAILSRFRIFDIAAPSRDESIQIVENLFAQIQHTRPRAFGNMRVNGSAIDKLLDLSPRKIKAALTTAAGNALIAGRQHICILDIENEPARKRKAIGFVS